MTTVLKFETSRPAAHTELQAGLIGYADRVEEMRSPDEVLEELHAVTTRHLPLSVMGAARLPLKSGDWTSIELGKLIFLHKSVPEGWWEEYEAVARGKFRPDAVPGGIQHGDVYLDRGEADVSTNWS